MKKLLLLALALGLVLPLHARKKKVPKLQILQDAGFKSSLYGKLKVGKVSAETFLESIKNIKNYDAVAAQIDEMNADLKDELQIYAEKEYPPAKGATKTLVVTATMTSFNAGSTAAAVMVGFGAGNGHCRYEIHFWDGTQDVGSFETTQTISRIQHGGWGRQDVTGRESRMRIPKAIVDLVDDFLAKH